MRPKDAFCIAPQSLHAPVTQRCPLGFALFWLCQRCRGSCSGQEQVWTFVCMHALKGWRIDNATHLAQCSDASRGGRVGCARCGVFRAIGSGPGTGGESWVDRAAFGTMGTPG